MKITIKESVTREVGLPKYFETKNTGAKIMLTGDGLSFVRVFEMELNPTLGLYPRIEIHPIYTLEYWVLSGFTPISEAEFKSAFLRVSLAIEETLNN